MDPEPPLPGADSGDNSGDNSDGSSLSTGVIVAIAVGAAAIIAIALGLLWWNRKRKSRKAKAMASKTVDGPFSSPPRKDQQYYQGRHRAREVNT